MLTVPFDLLCFQQTVLNSEEQQGKRRRIREKNRCRQYCTAGVKERRGLVEAGGSKGGRRGEGGAGRPQFQLICHAEPVPVGDRFAHIHSSLLRGLPGVNHQTRKCVSLLGQIPDVDW